MEAKTKRKSTKKEIAAACMSIAFLAYIVISVTLELFFPLEYAEAFADFVMQWIVNCAMAFWFFAVLCGIIALCITPGRRY